MNIMYRGIPYRWTSKAALRGRESVVEPGHHAPNRGLAPWERVMNVVGDAIRTGHIVTMEHRSVSERNGDVKEVIDVSIRECQE